MSQFPEWINGKPPIISLDEYDKAPWAAQSVIAQSLPDLFAVVELNKAEHVIAIFEKEANDTIKKIFASAKLTQYGH